MAKKSLNMMAKMMDPNIIDYNIINCAKPSIITIKNRYQIDFGKRVGKSYQVKKPCVKPPQQDHEILISHMEEFGMNRYGQVYVIFHHELYMLGKFHVHRHSNVRFLSNNTLCSICR